MRKRSSIRYAGEHGVALTEYAVITAIVVVVLIACAALIHLASKDRSNQAVAATGNLAPCIKDSSAAVPNCTENDGLYTCSCIASRPDICVVDNSDARCYCCYP